MKKLVALAAVCSLVKQFKAPNTKNTGLVKSEHTTPVSGPLTTSQSSQEEEEIRLEDLKPSNKDVRDSLEEEARLCYFLARNLGSLELIANSFDLRQRDDRLVWYVAAHSKALYISEEWKNIQEEMKTHLQKFKKKCEEHERARQESIAAEEASKKATARRIKGYLNEI